jgi:hypothetical protein
MKSNAVWGSAMLQIHLLAFAKLSPDDQALLPLPLLEQLLRLHAGDRQPTTSAQSRFIRVAKWELKALSPHEMAYLRFRALLAAVVGTSTVTQPVSAKEKLDRGAADDDRIRHPFGKQTPKNSMPNHKAPSQPPPSQHCTEAKLKKQLPSSPEPKIRTSHFRTSSAGGDAKKNCLNCRTPIAEARLKAMPNTRLCINCAKRDPSGQANRRSSETWGTRDDWKKDRSSWKRAH